MGALARIADAGRIRLGYRVDASPFSYRDDSGGPAGYSIALCQKIADAIKGQLRLPQLAVEWVPVSTPDRFEAVRRHTLDISCAADAVSLSRRKQVAFSIPIFPGGIGVLLRSDAPQRLKNVLNGKGQPYPFATVTSTSEAWLRGRITDLKSATTVAPVSTYGAGLDAVVQRRADAFFGERAMLLDLARRRTDVAVLDRLFTHEPLAFALPAGDEAFRLIVDRTLAHTYTDAPFSGFYSKWFGDLDTSTIAFFRWSAIPD